MRTLVSLAHYSGLPEPAGVTTWRRAPDAGATGARKLIAIVLRSVRLAWRARRFDRVVLVTAGLELFVLAALLPKGRLIAVDWLVPAARRLDRRWPLSRVRAFVVVRRSDTGTLARRFGVPARRCSFIPFPVTDAPLSDVSDDGYFYSAGWAHRDWDTLLAALRQTPVEALLSMPQKVADLPARIRSVNQLPPSVGRQWMSGARCVVLAFVDTDLPSGPLVLLDAMAHGKPVIVSDVGGARDYVEHGVTALVVPPHDEAALVEAIRQMESDGDLRGKLGQAAREFARGLTPSAFWAAVLDVATAR